MKLYEILRCHLQGRFAPMAVVVNSNRPHALLSSISDEIREGKIKTWLLDGDGDFTHEPQQWRFHLWFRPKIDLNSSTIVFNTIAPKGKTISIADYAIYHGRFIEMLLMHFDKSFTSAYATAQADSGDKLKGQ